MANATDGKPSKSGDVFLNPRLVGKRFDGGVVPLEVLADFSGLGELLIETAKWRFLQERDLKRSPKGFSKGVDFKLSGVSDGSAKLSIIVAIAQSVAAPLFPRAIAEYLPQAKADVLSAIDAAANQREIQLPDHLLGHFDRLGRSLSESESFEFPTDQDGKAVVLNKATRRTLLLASKAVEEITEVTRIRGMVSDVNEGKKTFEIQLADGHKVTGQLVARHRSEIHEALKGYTNRQRVMLECEASFDRNQKILRINSVEQITLLDPLDIPARLEELKSLKAGWLDGGGAALASNALQAIEDLFEANYPDNLASPYLYPTPDGDLEAEWSLPPYATSITINLRSLRGDMHSLNLVTDAETTDQFNFNDPADWKRLVEFVGKMPGAIP